MVEAVEIPTVIRWTPSQVSRHAPWHDRWACKSYGFMTPGPPRQLTATDDDAAGAVSSACVRARTHRRAAPSEPIFVVAVFFFM